MIAKKQLMMVLMIMILAGVLIGCPGGSVQKPNETIDPIKEQIEHMTLEEKIGQMIIAGFEGHEVDESVRTIINDYHVGGVILFSRNIKNSEQLLSIINALKNVNSASNIPLFISVDEEGGRVSRMPDAFKKIPVNKVIGEINNSDLSYRIGGILGEEIKAFGFNMNFAPVLDISSNPQNPVIGDRSFGDNPEIVSKLGIQTMKGIQDVGVISVVKHFPGHGDTSVDSHVGLPSVNYDMERLKSFELIPFIQAINDKADAVMIAHILMKKIDSENPASLSKLIITDLLRKQLKFKGVVITDDMTMGAVVNHYSISDAAIKAVNAGNDIILVCHGQDRVVQTINAIKKAVEDGGISKLRVDKSVYRILKLKEKYNIKDNLIDMVDIEAVNKRINQILLKYKIK